MPERRPHKRYPLDFLDITSAIIQVNDIEILDISLGGICLRTKRRLNPDDTYNLKIKSKDIMLNVKGTVMWSKISEIRKDAGDTVPLYTAGMRFDDVSYDKKAELINFIETQKKENKIIDMHQINGVRLYNRVLVNAPEEALILDQTESLKVKKLSYSGMLIECRHPIKINSLIPMMISFSEDRFIVFKGRVASCFLIRNASPKVYDLGIEFTELSGSERMKLAEYIRLLDAIDKSPSS